MVEKELLKSLNAELEEANRLIVGGTVLGWDTYKLQEARREATETLKDLGLGHLVSK